MSLKTFAVFQLPSHIQIFPTPWIAAWQASLSFIIFWSWPKLMSIEFVMPSMGWGRFGYDWVTEKQQRS